MRYCEVDNCEREYHARGYCQRHYIAARRRGELARRSPAERFAERFQIADRGCWLWTGSKDAKGYGLLGIGARKVRAHRFAWETYVAPIPEGAQIHHLCDEPACVNPDHLEPVDNAENQRRRWSRTYRCCDCGSTNIESIGDLDLTVT